MWLTNLIADALSILDTSTSYYNFLFNPCEETYFQPCVTKVFTSIFLKRILEYANNCISWTGCVYNKTIIANSRNKTPKWHLKISFTDKRWSLWFYYQEKNFIKCQVLKTIWSGDWFEEEGLILLVYLEWNVSIIARFLSLCWWFGTLSESAKFFRNGTGWFNRAHSLQCYSRSHSIHLSLNHRIKRSVYLLFDRRRYMFLCNKLVMKVLI